MTKQGLYKFQDGSSTGVELVPINGYIFIEDTGGSNKSIMLIDKSGITSTTTIDQLLALTSQWEDIGSSGIADDSILWRGAYRFLMIDGASEPTAFNDGDVLFIYTS